MNDEKKRRLVERVMRDLLFGFDLDREIREQAGLYFFYAMRWVEASRRVLVMKAELEHVEARLRKRFREELVGNGKRVTEGLLDELVKSDEEYRRVLEQYIEAKEEESFWQVVKEAMKQRKDMIEAWVNVSVVVGSLNESLRLSDIDVIRSRLREKLRGKMIKVEDEDIKKEVGGDGVQEG